MLYSKDDLVVKEDISNDNVCCFETKSNDTTIYNITNKCDLSKYIISFDKDIEIISNGAFSLHQLVKYIISILPPPTL